MFNGRPTYLLASALHNLAEPVFRGMDFLRRRKVELSIDGIRLNVSDSGTTDLPTPPFHTIINRSFLTPQIAAVTDPKISWYERKLKDVQQQSDKHPDFKIIEGRLFKYIPRKTMIANCPQWKLCIPNEKKQHILKEIHDDVTAGHLGVHKSIRRAQHDYYWPGMGRDIRVYVRSCTTCGMYKVEQSRKAGLMNTAPYTAQKNPTERANRVIKTMIAQNVGENHHVWDRCLAEISFAINTAQHESTQHSASEIISGRNLVASLQARREEDVPTEMPQKLIGDKVYCRNHCLSSAVDHFAVKLAPKFTGPYNIIGGAETRKRHIRVVQIERSKLA